MNPFSWLSARRRERLRRQRDAVWARREFEALMQEINGWGEAELFCRPCPVSVQCKAHKRKTGASAGVWGSRKAGTP